MVLEILRGDDHHPAYFRAKDALASEQEEAMRSGRLLERDRIVAWLREDAQYGQFSIEGQWAADAIADGDHEKGGGK